MQLGTRWSVGAEPPDRLSPDVRAAVRSVEGELLGRDTTAWRWTLTWLEGQPVVELDDGTIIRQGHDGAIEISDGDTPR
jgi:hypothetical protein